MIFRWDVFVLITCMLPVCFGLVVKIIFLEELRDTILDDILALYSKQEEGTLKRDYRWEWASFYLEGFGILVL